MAEIETIRHEPMVYEVHELITSNPGKFFPVRDLCWQFFGKYTKSMDTKMRNIVTEIVNDRGLQKIIISTKDGYLSPTIDQAELVEESIEEIKKTARALFYRRASIKYRVDHDQQMKLKIGKNDSPSYEAYEREAVEEFEMELAEKAKKKNDKIRPEAMILQTESGQMSFGIY